MGEKWLISGGGEFIFQVEKYALHIRKHFKHKKN